MNLFFCASANLCFCFSLFPYDRFRGQKNTAPRRAPGSGPPAEQIAAGWGRPLVFVAVSERVGAEFPRQCGQKHLVRFRPRQRRRRGGVCHALFWLPATRRAAAAGRTFSRPTQRTHPTRKPAGSPPAARSRRFPIAAHGAARAPGLGEIL